MNRHRVIRSSAAQENRFVLPAVLLPALAVLRIAGVLFIGRPGSEAWERKISYSDTYSFIYAAEQYSDGTPDSPLLRTPGYPLILLATRDLLGSRWTATMLANQLFELLTALVIVRITSSALGRLAGLWSGVFYLILPSGIIYSSFMIPDVLIAFFSALTGFFWLKASAGPSRTRAAGLGLAAGFCFALGFLIKPVMLFASTLYLALALPYHDAKRTGVLFGVMAILPCVAVYFPLRLYNQNNFGLPGLTTQDALEPMGRAVQMADFHGLGQGGKDFWLFRDSLEALARENGVMNWSARDSIFRKAALEALVSNPVRVVYMEISRWPKFFVNLDGHQPYLGLTPSDRKPVWYSALTTVLQFPLLLGLLHALFKTGARRRLGRLFRLGMGWFLFTVLAVGPIASFRYGLLFYWALVPFAAVYAESFLPGRERKAL